MRIINVLDEHTINCIAAGEVVERPVSVVKELVENSVDAGASAVSIEIKDGGIGMIRVTDNGRGIDKDDIRTAFCRHATSKIKDVTDLVSIGSLGFRGEALSSIAAVSHVELLTKTHDSFSGIRYVVSGGREEVLEDAGIPDGTTFIVRDLFYNTPARRKFMKSSQTEASYITELVGRLILSHPEVAFKYVINGSLKLRSNGNNNSKEDIYEIFGRDSINHLIPISSERDGVLISGFVGKPDYSRGNRNYELIFVNKRSIKSKVVSSALEQAYKPYLMLHKYPFCVLYLSIGGEDLDVNVHPAKTEIRFLKETLVYDAIFEAVSVALSQDELIPEVKVEFDKAKPASIEKRLSGYTRISPASNDIHIDNEPVIASNSKMPADDCSVPAISEISAPEPFETERINAIKKETEPVDIVEVKQGELFTEGFLENIKLKKYKIVGQVFDTYWIVESDGKMYIIDQHAAHEKVLYERIHKQIESGSVNSQILCPPIVISLTRTDVEIINRFEDNFRTLGFEIEHFGGNEYSIRAVPTDLFGMDEKVFFRTVLDELYEGHFSRTNDSVNDRIATMACKAAIKGNMSISFQEADALIGELLALENPYNCPHGRPTIVSYSKSELEKMFKRIV